MKKLLLVMLVPVLVLGVMGCGAKTPDGSPNPIGLQGLWNPPAGSTSPSLVIAGNEVTLLSNSSTYLGNIALRTSYNGSKGDADSGIFTTGATDPEIEFFWFDDPFTKIGSIKFTVPAGGATFTVTEVKYDTYYQNVMLPANTTVYTKQ
jgi:hypothetical protein